MQQKNAYVFKEKSGDAWKIHLVSINVRHHPHTYEFHHKFFNDKSLFLHRFMTCDIHSFMSDALDIASCVCTGTYLVYMLCECGQIYNSLAMEMKDLGLITIIYS